MLKVYLILFGLIAMCSFQVYEIKHLREDVKNITTREEMQKTIYNNEIDNLSKSIISQNNEISSLKLYSVETEKNNEDINNIKKKYISIPKDNAKDINSFQNNIFDNFSQKVTK